jgi:hypothetical protein
MERNRFILITFLCITLTSAVRAQPITDSLRLADRVWAMKKKALVVQYFKLTEAEKAAFWPVYDSYYSATQYLEMEYIHLLSVYQKNNNSLSGEKLEELSAQMLKNDVQMARVRRMYFRKFKRALSPMQASTFMQLDNTFRTMMRNEVGKGLTLEELSVNSYSRNR